MQGEIWEARARVTLAALASGPVWLARFLYVASLGHSHMRVCLDIVSGCFRSVMVEFYSGEGMVWPAKPKLLSHPLWKTLLSSHLAE